MIIIIIIIIIVIRVLQVFVDLQVSKDTWAQG